MKGKRKTDKIVCFLLAFLFFFCAGYSLSDRHDVYAQETVSVQETEKSEEEMRQNVLNRREEIVRVESICWDGESRVYRTKFFSGFVVSKDTSGIYVVTVQKKLAYTAKEKSKIRKKYSLEENARIAEKTEVVFDGDLRVEAKTVGESEQRNLTLLQLSQSVNFDKTAVFARENASDNDPIFLLGYPDTAEGEEAVYSIENVRLTSGTVLSTYLENEIAFYRHDILTDSGSRGGPLYNGDGTVIGMLLTSSGDEEEGTAISCEDIKAFLETFGVAFQEEEEPEIAEKKLPVLNYALGAVLAVLLILVIVRQIESVRSRRDSGEDFAEAGKAVRRRNKKDAGGRHKAAEGREAGRNRKDGRNQKPEPKGRSAAIPAASLGYPSGKQTVKISKSAFLIGRIREADFVISGNPEISRRHACIRYEGDGFSLSDLGSANHTLLNGIQLEPGERRPLHDGDEVMVGKERLVFHIY